MSEAMMVIKSRAQIEPIQGRKTASGDPMRLRAAMLERRQSTAHEHDLMRERGMSAAAEASSTRKHAGAPAPAATDLEEDSPESDPDAPDGKRMSERRGAAPALPGALVQTGSSFAPIQKQMIRFRSSPATVAPE
jgi:hypothetical protein